MQSNLSIITKSIGSHSLIGCLFVALGIDKKMWLSIQPNSIVLKRQILQLRPYMHANLDSTPQVNIKVSTSKQMAVFTTVLVFL